MGISFRPNGMTSSAQALRYLERRQEVVANNLANVSTDGFKAERTFGRLLEGSIPVVETQTDMRAGTMRPTGAPLDIALGGDGFLVVDGPEGERLTRGGAFRLDDRHRVVTADGMPLLGEGGPIVVDPAVAREAAAQARDGAGAAAAAARRRRRRGAGGPRRRRPRRRRHGRHRCAWRACRRARSWITWAGGSSCRRRAALPSPPRRATYARASSRRATSRRSPRWSR